MATKQTKPVTEPVENQETSQVIGKGKQAKIVKIEGK
jgi:hypothetical protein